MQIIEEEKRVYSGYNFSYARYDDPWLKKWIIRGVENATGKKELQKVYNQLHDNEPDPFKVWKEALDQLNISMDYDEGQLQRIPKSGPVIFVANHPFGIVDGVMFLHLITRVRRDYFLLINEVLAHEPIMKEHLLPVDFRGTEEAKQCNLNTKKLTTERLNRGESLVIFPSGAISTRPRWSLRGEAVEWPWRRFICSRIHETKCTVVPFYFHGQNSEWFQWVSKFSMNLRLGLLLHEVMNKRNRNFRVEIGDPIPYEKMQLYSDRQELIEFLKRETLSLKERG